MQYVIIILRNLPTNFRELLIVDLTQIYVITRTMQIIYIHYYNFVFISKLLSNPSGFLSPVYQQKRKNISNAALLFSRILACISFLAVNIFYRQHVNSCNSVLKEYLKCIAQICNLLHLSTFTTVGCYNIKYSRPPNISWKHLSTHPLQLKSDDRQWPNEYPNMSLRSSQFSP